MHRTTRSGFSILRRPGDGRRVHFAHATGFNAETYRELFASIDARLDLHALDARGHGFTAAPADPPRLKSWKRYQYDLSDYLHSLEGPSVLVGHSMGATISIQIAAEEPELVSALVLIEPVLVRRARAIPYAVGACFGLTRFAPIAKAARSRRTHFSSREEAVDNYEGKGPFRSWSRNWIEAYVDGGTREVEDGTVLCCDPAWESETYARLTPNPYRYIDRIRCPVTLMAAGRGSTCAPPHRRDFLRAQPDARLIERDDCSHFLPMEDPEAVRVEIERMAFA